MIRESTKELIALMEQENGVTEFQYASIINGEWDDCSTPTAPRWGTENKFRVKPKPVEIWVWKYPSGLIGQWSYDNKQPDDTSGHSRVMILMREVTE